MLRIVCDFTFNGVRCIEYLCEEVDDGLPLHEHTFNHLTKVTAGKVQVFTDDGVTIDCGPGEDPIEYVAGRKHGIRGLLPGSMFMNIGPVLLDDHPSD